MNKTTLALVVAFPLAAAYPLASWMIGAQTEKLLDAQYAQFQNNPYLKLVERKTQRGIFSSEEIATFEFTPEFIQQVHAALDKVTGEDGAQSSEPIRFSMRSNIQHGPFPAFSSFGLATAHSEIEVNNPAITKLYGGRSPLYDDTYIDFSGGTQDKLRSPAIEGVNAENMHFSWGELVLDSSYNRELTAFTLQGELPFFKLRSEDSTRSLDVGAIKLNAHQTRPFADAPNFLTGPFHMSVASLDVQGAECEQNTIHAENLVATSNVTEAAGFVDVSLGYALDKLAMGDMSYSDAHLDLAFRHLEAKALVELNQESRKLDQSAKEELDLQRLKPLFKPAKVILENSPEFAIERLSVLTPEGAVQAKAVTKLPNANVGDLESVAKNPMLLMGLASVVEFSAQVSSPEALVQSGLNEEQAAMLPNLVKMG